MMPSILRCQPLTLNGQGERTGNLYDHLIVFDADTNKTKELVAFSQNSTNQLISYRIFYALDCTSVFLQLSSRPLRSFLWSLCPNY